jgi:hypothetical protein
VEVAREVQVEDLHRHDLAVAAARRPALDPEGRAHRRLADRHRRPLSDVGERLPEADRGGGLALAERGGGDGGDHDVLGPAPVGQLVDRRKLDLGDVLAVGLHEVGPDAHALGDVAQGLERRGLGDPQVWRERHQALLSDLGV